MIGAAGRCSDSQERRQRSQPSRQSTTAAWEHPWVRRRSLPVKHSRCLGAAVCSWALTKVLQRTPRPRITCPPADATDKGCARQRTAMHRFPDAGGDLLGSLNLLVLPQSSCSTWPSAVGGLGEGCSGQRPWDPRSLWPTIERTLPYSQGQKNWPCVT